MKMGTFKPSFHYPSIINIPDRKVKTSKPQKLNKLNLRKGNYQGKTLKFNSLILSICSSISIVCFKVLVRTLVCFPLNHTITFMKDGLHINQILAGIQGGYLLISTGIYFFLMAVDAHTSRSSSLLRRLHSWDTSRTL